MQPHSRTATAMPRKPAVILLKSNLRRESDTQNQTKGQKAIENYGTTSFVSVVNVSFKWRALSVRMRGVLFHCNCEYNQ
jgi:hypothetical protein